jgi:hypothetical protein
MFSLIMEFALFLLVLFVLVPGTVAFFMVGRDALHRKSAGWHKDSMGKLLS